jgi:TolA-binding protein
MDLHRARNDRAAEQRAATQLDELLAKDPNNPAAAAAIARRNLLAATRSLEGRDFRKAIDQINASRDRLAEPAQQAEALYILAEARYGLADPKSSDALKDAALAYMRVVAHFRNDPARPFVPQSLLRTGQIHEQIGEPQTAAAVYQQIVEQFKDDPAAQVARQHLQRLGRASDAGR